VVLKIPIALTPSLKNSTKHERERKGEKVDLQSLIHTHKRLSISLRNFNSNPWER